MDKITPTNAGQGMMDQSTMGQGSQMSPKPEGQTTRAIENVTARVPSQVWLWAAGASIVGSLALFLSGRRLEGILVGLWPPTFLVIGNYNKIVKSLGST
jgi:hypothetical protein